MKSKPSNEVINKLDEEIAQHMQAEEYKEKLQEEHFVSPPPSYKIEQLIPDKPHYMQPPNSHNDKVIKKPGKSTFSHNTG
jgi:hypothetical protein